MARTLTEKLRSLPEERRQLIEARAAELIEQEVRSKLTKGRLPRTRFLKAVDEDL